MAVWDDLFGGSGTGKALIMPSASGLTAGLKVKTALATVAGSNNNAFFDAFIIDHSPLGYETTKFTGVSDATEQTMLSESGFGGVLTTIVLPAPLATGIITCTISIDTDEDIIFTFNGALATQRCFIGGFLQGIEASASTTHGTSFGGGNDSGYNISAVNLMLTPSQALNEGIGLKFNNSVTVKVQISSSISSGSVTKLGAVGLITSQTEGL